MTTLDLKSLSQSEPLLILDMANNHNGSLSHGKQIIDDLASVEGIRDFSVAIKFQYRDLPNFIHPEFRERRDIKYVDRFLSTMLTWNDFKELKNYITSKGFLTACTPFDELSVEKIIEHKFDILKIASASFTDWPLLEKINLWNGSVVASTAGASIEEIYRVVAYFQNRSKNFAIMHCVAAYPTADDALLLKRISLLKQRYPEIPIGYSTHEDPNNFLAGPIALGAGAVILERHVGSEANETKLNGYSSEKNQLNHWISNIKQASKMIGPDNPWELDNSAEKDALGGLRRYVFANRLIKAGEAITLNDVYFAIPGDASLIQANNFGKYDNYVAKLDIPAGSGISITNSSLHETQKIVFQIRDKAVKLIKDAGVVVPRNSVLEISHHYGINEFDQYGTCMITVVNREYCKKLLLLLPGQTHPGMFHKIKDETFFLLHGDLQLLLNEVDTPIATGETVSIAPGVIHEFSTKNGAVIEEVSSSHIPNDSFYKDEAITNNNSRKTYVQYWL